MLEHFEPAVQQCSPIILKVRHIDIEHELCRFSQLTSLAGLGLGLHFLELRLQWLYDLSVEPEDVGVTFLGQLGLH